jgi:hypothetical protein
LRFDIRFLPRDQRKALSYELVQGAPAFKALVNDREVWALLDNQTSRSLIDETFARAIGLQLTPQEGRVLTATGELRLWRAPTVDLVIPGQVRVQAPVLATDLSRLSAFADRPLSFAVGKEYFNSLLFMFTPRNREIKLGPSGSLRTPADTPYVLLQNDVPQIEVMIAGRPTLLTIDLGYNGDIALSPEAWDRLDMNERPTTPNRSVNAEGVIIESVATEVDDVSLDSRPLKAVKIKRAPTLAEHGDGRVGFGLLSRFNFALDVKARRLWLIPPFPAE